MFHIIHSIFNPINLNLILPKLGENYVQYIVSKLFYLYHHLDEYTLLFNKLKENSKSLKLKFNQFINQQTNQSITR